MALSTEELTWAWNKLEECIFQNDLDCSDNIRIADVDDTEEMKQYEQIAEKGCCGSFEEVIIHPNGKKIMIGCNYGH
jgi:hypothetical protein